MDKTEIEKLIQEKIENHKHTGFDSLRVQYNELESDPKTLIDNPTDATVSYNQANIQEIVDAVNAILQLLKDQNLMKRE